MKAVINATYSYFKTITQSFSASSSFGEYTIPDGVTKIKVDCVASKGKDEGTSKGGNGGRVQCVLPVTAGQTLYFYVGGTNSNKNVAEYNASDIRTDNTGVTDSTSLNSRLVVAGGGGSGCASSYNGGAGGGTVGAGGGGYDNGYGRGGTQNAGGEKGNRTIGTSGSNGTLGLGGNGGGDTETPDGCGCGGAGWYGGGGGSPTHNHKGDLFYGAGGGGSSYTSSGCLNVEHTQGYQNGQGYITITVDVPATSSDYDFRVATIQAKAISQDGNLYAVKSYEKGEYFGE